MILPHPTDAIHQAWLYRILSGIADNSFLAGVLRFKGGTCCAMQGFIDRFSVDLDFDLIDEKKQKEVHAALKKLLRKLDLKIKDESRKEPQFFLKYDNTVSERNTLRIDVTFPAPKSNTYEPVRFAEIDRIFYCQTIETMFANKLVALLDRYEKHHSITGRDLFDLHTFLLKGYGINKEVIKERRGTGWNMFIPELLGFIEKKVTQQIIDEDLYTLLPPEIFKRVRKTIKPEVELLLKGRL